MGRGGLELVSCVRVRWDFVVGGAAVDSYPLWVWPMWPVLLLILYLFVFVRCVLLLCYSGGGVRSLGSYFVVVVAVRALGFLFVAAVGSSPSWTYLLPIESWDLFVFVRLGLLLVVCSN